MYEHSAAGRLIKFESEDGFILDGMLFEANSCRGIVVHIHGNYGNFYNNYFLYRMSCMYTANGYSFMTFNLSGHDGLAEGYWGNQLRYIGGAVSDFERCLVEIDAAVGVANEHAKRVILEILSKVVDGPMIRRRVV
ncbi:MAG: alpha/beta fold hydrolase [Phycisphaerales bacterium]